MEKIIAIYGGPRKNMNTEKLLDTFLDGIDKSKVLIEKVRLKDLDISLCQSCYGCSKDGNCVIYDDMTELYRKIGYSDIIILASPIYFAGISSLTKIMIDRCQAFWSAKYIANVRRNEKKKKGYFIATAGSDDEDMLNLAKPAVKLFFAACDADYFGELFAGNTDKLPVERNNSILKEAFSLGKDAAI